MFKAKAKVILDTNMLMLPGQMKIDVFSEVDRIMDVPFQICVIDKTFDELNKLVMVGKQRDREAAKLGFVLAKTFEKQKSLKTIASSSNGSVDDIIVSKAKKGVFVATIDKELKRRVKETGATIITLKQKKYLVKE